MKGTINISISKDMMNAYALVERSDYEEVTVDGIKDALAGLGVKAGIDDDAILAIVEKEIYDEEVTIATGKEAVLGADAHYEFKFDTNKREYTPIVLEDGSVDYTFQRQLVKAGDVLAIYVPAKSGYFGYTVFADVVAPVPSKGCSRLECNGAKQVENDIIAEIDGEVSLIGNTINVIDYLTIPGNASNVMGDIIYKGDIHIKGDVLAGCNIIVTGNVYVDGDVEAATIDAGKDIIIKKGIHGQQKAVIKAEGSVCASFVEEATVIAGEQVRFNYAYNSHIFSMKDVIAEGRYGSIVGGDVEARNLISINSAGNEAEVSTILRIEATDERIPQLSCIEIKKRLYQGVDVQFGSVHATIKEYKGEYHLVRGVARFYELGTFEEEQIYIPVVEEKKKTVLLVDDEPIILKTFFTYLRNDYDVLAVSSAKDAFKVLEKTLPDLILLDFNMPVMNGGQMLEQLRKTTWRPYHNVPVIFASAVADKEVVAHCLSLYPQGYIVKPLGEKDLRSAVDKFFGK